MVNTSKIDFSMLVSHSPFRYNPSLIPFGVYRLLSTGNGTTDRNTFVVSAIAILRLVQSLPPWPYRPSVVVKTNELVLDMQLM